MKKFFGIITVLIIIAASIFVYKQFSKEEVTFAQLSDIHIWSVFENDSVKPTYPERILNAALEQINENKNVDFTIITGDIVDAPDYELFLHVVKSFRRLSKPWYFALGNHDCSYPIEVAKEPLAEIIKNENPNYIEDGKVYAFKPKKGFTFIALDGGSYNIDDSQVEFMNKTIKENPDDVIVIFLHTPILPPMDLPTHVLFNEDALLENFKQFTQPVAIFAGHFHATKITQDGNILHVASPSLRYGQEFRTVNIKNEKDKAVFTFKYEHVNTGENFENNLRYKGEEADKNTVIVIEKPKKTK